MDDLQDKLNAVLANPQLMQQLMSVAQGISGSAQAEQHELPTEAAPDARFLQTAMRFLQQSNIDTQQQTLLHALVPYLSAGKLGKLEKAMRAAKLAGLATELIKDGHL